LWGDSITLGSTVGVRSKSNYSIYGGGVGGETSTQIKARFLAATDATRGEKASIWVGHNNLVPATIKADIAAMVAAFTGEDYIVLSLLNSDAQGIGTEDYDTIIALNNDLAATYGSRYFDIRAWFVAQYDPNDAQDVIDHDNDIPPSSLRENSLHPNTAGYALLGGKIAALLGIEP
jgi:lysophospholipase L1-like esterase